MVKGNNGKQAIIPDAYSIDITIESLVSDINNLYEQQLGDAGMKLDENTVFRLSSALKETPLEITRRNANLPDNRVQIPGVQDSEPNYNNDAQITGE